MTNVAHWQQYIHIASESTFGVAGSSWIHLPYAECSIQATPRLYEGDPVTGWRQSRTHRQMGYSLAGNLNCPLYGNQVAGVSIAQKLIQWALNQPNGLLLDSYSVEQYDGGVNNRRWLGNRVNSITISGDAESGVIQAQLALIGKSESGSVTCQTLSATSTQPIEAIMSDCTLWLQSGEEATSDADAADAIDIASFSLTVNNNLQPKFCNSSTITHLSAGKRQTNFEFTVYKDSGIFDALNLSTAINNYNATLKFAIPHNGTGTGTATTNTTVALDLSRISFSGASNAGGLNDLIKNNVKWACLKPNTTDNEIDATFGES